MLLNKYLQELWFDLPIQKYVPEWDDWNFVVCPMITWKGSSHYLQLGSFWPGWCRFGVGNISGFWVGVWAACGLAYFLLERLLFQWNASNVQFPAKRLEIVVHLASVKNNWDLEALGRKKTWRNTYGNQHFRANRSNTCAIVSCVLYTNQIHVQFFRTCFWYIRMLI